MYIHIRNNYKAEILQEYDSVVECMRGSRKFYWVGGGGGEGLGHMFDNFIV